MATLASTRIESLTKATFRERIAQQLRAAILCGEIVPGAALVETALAERFSVSRAPLREALRQLAEEGLIVTIPYTGTHVIELTAQDVREIHSMRTTLERFAFEQAWPVRDQAFRSELVRRKSVLTRAIDRRDSVASIAAELDLHGLVYESSGHALLHRSWTALRGRLPLYWAAHHSAHRARGPRRDAHDSYVETALGDDLTAMLAEVSQHMLRGAGQTERFLSARARSPGSASLSRPTHLMEA